MSRIRTVHRCSECGATSPRWAGRCAGCDAWGTLVEEVEAPAHAPAGGLRSGGFAGADRLGKSDVASRSFGGAGAVALGDIDGGAGAPVPTGLDELDRVLGGGLVPGGATLLGGEPGIGKSTLLLQAAASLARRGQRCLLVSAEESAQQVRRRAERLGAVVPGVWLVAETSVPAIRAGAAEIRPDVIVVDSIQTVWDPELESAPGSVTQVRGCAQNLVALAKAEGIAVVLVGHVTKEGALAGPR
ncbi:MAG: AAA family ATPase, partial [Acidimicrobiales bacterium]